jgi:anthranilate synthase component I
MVEPSSKPVSAERFAELAAQGYNRIPVVVETLADLDTPLSTYLKLAKGPYSYLLESAQGGEKWGRYSIIGLPCRTVLKVTGRRIEVSSDGQVQETHETDDPLSFVEEFQKRYRVAELPDLPRFYGGLVGYFGYDCVRYVEKRLAGRAPPDQLGTPDIVLMVSEDVVVFDNLKGRMQLISLVDPSRAEIYQRTLERLQALAGALHKAVPPIAASTANQPVEESDFVSDFGEAPFKESVEKIRDYIRAGDVMQVVLSQRMSIPFAADSINLYRALRSLNPSPYMYFMDLQDFQIVSSSPEILARLEDGLIINRPLAGTRRRGHTPEEDRALEAELLADPKELAEHLMLIDLGRNDVGRVSETGSVEVTEQFVIERLSHVMHISSNVTGRLKAGKTAMDVLRATLPVGTL